MRIALCRCCVRCCWRLRRTGSPARPTTPGNISESRAPGPPVDAVAGAWCCSPRADEGPGAQDHARAPRGDGRASARRSRRSTASSMRRRPTSTSIRAQAATMAPTRREGPELVPGGHRPRRRQDRRQARNLAEAGGFRGQGPQISSGAAQAFDAAAARRRRERDQGALHGDLGKTCKACHDKYRAEMKH